MTVIAKVIWLEMRMYAELFREAYMQTREIINERRTA